GSTGAATAGAAAERQLVLEKQRTTPGSVCLGSSFFCSAESLSEELFLATDSVFGCSFFSSFGGSLGRASSFFGSSFFSFSSSELDSLSPLVSRFSTFASSFLGSSTSFFSSSEGLELSLSFLAGSVFFCTFVSDSQ